MAQPPTRSIWGVVFRNFINSFIPRQFKGTLMGTDYFGNKYYEILKTSYQRKSRWFVPPEKENFMQEMPAEWESWLRGRRKVPPTDEEVMKNVAIMQLKKKNAIAVDAKGGKMTPMQKGHETFPLRNEYENTPGRKQST